VGLKPDPLLGEHLHGHSFRRTLVGLKRPPSRGWSVRRKRFRRTLVGLKRSGKGDKTRDTPVSDGPLWG